MDDSPEQAPPAATTEPAPTEGASGAPSIVYTPLRRPDITTVVLLGHATSSRHAAPFDRPDVEIWTMNDSHGWLPPGTRIDRWFEIHTPTVYREPTRRAAGYRDHLRAFPGPVYMQEPDPEFPTSVRYPLELVAATFGGDLRAMRGPFGSSFSYMQALALLEGFTRIEMYGCDLASAEEYRKQRESTAYFIGWARGAGVQFVLPDGTPLLDSPFYGREVRLAPTITKDEVMNRMQQVRTKLGQLQAEMWKLQGMADADQWWATKLDHHG